MAAFGTKKTSQFAYFFYGEEKEEEVEKITNMLT